MIHLIHRYRLPAFHVFLGFCFHLVGKEAHAGEIAGRLRLATRPDLTGSAPVANRRESSKSQLSWRARKRPGCIDYVTLRSTSWAASAGNQLTSLSAKR